MTDDISRKNAAQQKCEIHIFQFFSAALVCQSLNGPKKIAMNFLYRVVLGSRLMQIKSTFYYHTHVDPGVRVRACSG